MASGGKTKARKPSKVVKPTKSKKQSTISTKNHRFKPFSQRVANLKIDPIRRRRKPEDQGKLEEDTATYFGRSLTEWRDLNLSATFTAFAKEAAPLCDSLPVVLHNEEKIIDLLVTYIEKADGLAIEPLLSLLSHFAHDLDSRFEKHFRRAVNTVASVAAKHPDPAVVEWSFNCLAWLFKYLSRLLTPDLRPLYDLMAPYLGKQSQRPFIIRFAAESMSFLVRKAAAKYQTNPEPLDLFVSHMFEGCQDEAAVASGTLLEQGILTLLVESIKGVQSDIHSSGLSVLQSMLKNASKPSMKGVTTVMSIVKGTITSLIHDCDAESFRPIQDAVLSFVDNEENLSDSFRVKISAELILTISTVRKGTRTSDWRHIIKLLQRLVFAIEQHQELEESASSSVLAAVAIGFHSAPLDAVLPALDIVVTLRTGSLAPHFLKFCDLFARLDREKFQDLLLPQFQKFVLEQYESAVDDIFLRLPNLAPQEKRMFCSEGLQNEIAHRCRFLTQKSDIDGCEEIYRANFALASVPYLRLKDAIHQTLQAELLSLIAHSLDKFDCVEIDYFALGAAFSAVLDETDRDDFAPTLLPSLCSASSRFLALEKFWSNLLRYTQLCSSSRESLDWSHIDTLKTSLLKCLSMPSHSIRQSALELIRSLYKLQGSQLPDVLDIAISIESTPVNFETSRSISMNIRRLASAYSNDREDEFLRKVIPTYCFGLLHLQLSQAWNDSILALSEMSKSSIAEEVITSTAQSWLETGEDLSKADQDRHGVSESILNSESKGFQVASDFECSNFAKVTAICQQVFETPCSGYLSAQDQFQSKHALVPQAAHDARGKALKVLNQMPSLAEKRSRTLVPFLLRWAGIAKSDHEEGDQVHDSAWNRKDQKLLLSVFAKFTNPRVLFKTTEVYNALLNLCANGDVEIQHSALKAIFTWKEPAVIRYEEHLTNILDEARFSEEISVFLQDTGNNDEIMIDPNDHAKLMPILLRLLYGRAVAASKSEQSARRKAIFVALSSYSEDVLGMFVDITLRSVGRIALVDNIMLDEQSLSRLNIPLRQQLGMVNMLDDILDTLGPKLESFGVPILDALLLCSVLAARKLDEKTNNEEIQDLSLLRSTRQGGIQALAKAFTVFSDLNLAAYAKIASDELVAPRLERFSSENTQSISGLLRLLAAWASTRDLQHLLESPKSILEAVASLLGSTYTKDDVRIFILQEIVDKLMSDNREARMTGPQITNFVRSLHDILEQAPAKHVLDACVTSFTKLSAQIQNPQEAENVVRVCSELLTKPNKAVSNATKSGLLKTILPLLEICESPFQQDLYDAVCSLFSRFYEPESRALLSTVLLKICVSDMEFLEAAQICQDLNSLGHRLDEPDLARREAAFSKIYEKHEQFSVAQWKGIVHNCLFYVRDADDLVNRTSASRALEKFVDAASLSLDDFKPLLFSAVLPGVIHGIKNPSELVRAEYLSLVGHLVEQLPGWPAVSDMTNLTAHGDEEASFFTNVLHIQQHRRLRALRRLSDEAADISPRNATQLFFPLLEHFVFEPAPGDSGRTLADQSISTLGALSAALNWSFFRSTFRRYVSLLGSETQEKVALRLLNGLSEGGNVRRFLDDGSALESSSPSEKQARSTSEQRTTAIIRDMLTPLMDYLHHKDESTVDRRMPVALTVVRMLKWLPEEILSSRLPAILTDVCHVLRSRSQEARDQTRKTLCQIVTLIGPSYFGFVLKELRTALQRGYQLHVLSFTIHSLLVHVGDEYQPGDLNSCLSEIVSVVMDDIFGVTGQEKDAEDYKSSMKEVRSSKSFDTMELLARVTPVRQLGLLLKPIRALLSEKLNTKTLRKTDDLLVRLRKGIDRNPAANNVDILIFCHEIVTHTTRNSGDKGLSVNDKKALIGPSQSHAFRIVSFAFDLVRKSLRRHEHLATAANLTGFLPVLGDALVEGQEEVQLSALKLIASIMKIPLQELDTNAPIYVGEAVKYIRAATNVTTDAAKAGLELVTSVLRDRPAAQVRDKDLADILSALKGSIDEPDRQGIVYKFIRAILNRKIMITEVYDIMDEVGRVLVTNADRNVRESARGAYLQFILEYPQTTKRWKKQSEKFIENLQYQHSSGRQSVMELLYQLANKAPDEMLSKLASKVFMPLVLVQNSDQDVSCQEMARLLLGKLFEASNDDLVNEWLTLLDKWLQHEASSDVQIAALQSWTIVLRTRIPSEQRLTPLRDSIADLLPSGNAHPAAIDEHIAKNALQTFETLVEVAPSIAFSMHSQPIWKSLDEMLSSPIAARLLGAYFSHLASSSSRTGRGLSNLPLTGADGLRLSGDDMLHKCSAILRLLTEGTETVGEALKDHIVRNLVFLGRCFAANGLQRRASKRDEDLDEDIYHSALGYLFSRLSYIVRQENVDVSSRSAAIDCQIALTSAIELVPNITTVLRPLYTLTDRSVSQSNTGLVDKAREFMDLLQKRVGKDAYIRALGTIQTEAKERRADRRTKRKIEMVTRPGKRTKVK